MSAPPTTPDTIVLIHGFWVTPRSWEGWIERYESRGYRVIAPAYPGFEVEVEALNADPSPIEEQTIPGIIEHLEGVIAELDSEPILMGHSAGGAWTQLLLDRGHGAAGVAICSAPTEGVKVVPISQVRSTFPVLKNPANRHRAVGLDFDHWTLRVHEQLPRGRGAADLRALPHPGPWLDRLGRRPRERHSGPPGRVGRLQERRPRAATLHLGERGPHHAAEGAAVEREALQVRHDHRGQGVRGLRAPPARPGGLGGGRRLRARSGRSSTPRFQAEV